VWLGELHHSEKVNRMQLLAKEWQWQKVADLLAIMATEADFPAYFYTLREIGRRGALDIPKRSRLIEALQEAGYRATATHINAEAIKTDADIHTCIAIAQRLQTI
jgi:tRNA (guanine26-N2/guanine27-N2)-dimethyltransferase